MSVEIGIDFDDLSDADKIERLRFALETLAMWLVACQTGFGQHDYASYQNVVQYGQAKAPT